MWNNALALSKRGLWVSAKVLHPQNQNKLYERIGEMSQVWDDVRTSMHHQTTASNQNIKTQSLLEVKKRPKPIQVNPLNSLHVKAQNVSNLIGEKVKEIERNQSELDELRIVQKLLNSKIISLGSRPNVVEFEKKSKQFQGQVDIEKWRTNFAWSEGMKRQLAETFDFHKFRPMQLEAINATMCNEDVILIAATGGGKSICFQLPALLSSGITIVVSPLLSLMEDQVMQLRKLGISAQMLSSSTSYETVLDIYHSMEQRNPDFKLLYVTPEKISKSKHFMAQLQKCYNSNFLSRFVIDEVHCVSQWGNSFRPDYKTLGVLKRLYPEVPVIGLTATATPKIVADVKEILNIPDAVVMRSQLSRPNLFHEVRLKPTTHAKVVDDMASTIKKYFNGKSGLVYCLSRRNCTDVSNGLIKHGISSDVYHGRLSPENKTKVHQRWANNEIQVLCSTVAFGMGIDKHDVRFVIHHSISKSLEIYFQESGRAGRDGKPALCLLYFGFRDIFRQSSLAFAENNGMTDLKKMIEYCSSTKICRQRFFAQHFGDVINNEPCSGKCDICTGLQKTVPYGVTRACLALLDIVKSQRKEKHSLTAIQLVDQAWRLKKKGERLENDLRGFRREHLERIVLYMISEDFLSEKFYSTSYKHVSYITCGARAQNISKLKDIKLDLQTTKSLHNNDYEDFLKS